MMAMFRRLRPTKHALQLLIGDEVHISIIRRLFQNESREQSSSGGQNGTKPTSKDQDGAHALQGGDSGIFCDASKCRCL
jgi:hypothetical protein